MCLYDTTAHYAQFVVEMAEESSPLELRMPLLIGTVPLHREFSKFQQEPTSPNLDEVPQTIQTKYSNLRK